jgi:hypothetical protein
VLDGTAAIAIGGIVSGGFGGEAARSFVTGEVLGRWWFIAGLAAGLALAGVGLWLRERAQQLDQQAEMFSRNLHGAPEDQHRAAL